MKVLVTGGAGFVGWHVCKSLLGLGCRVLALDNLDAYYDYALKRANLKDLEAERGFQHTFGDVCRRDFLNAQFSEFGPECVVHLAAIPGVRHSVARPTQVLRANVEGTGAVLDACSKYGVRRVVQASSSSVYGAAPSPFKEGARTDLPLSPYAASKVAAEHLAHSAFHNFGLSTVSLRLFSVYGPRQRPDLAVRRFVLSALQAKAVFLYGDGTATRDFTWAGDVAQAVEAALEWKGGLGVFNVGAGKATSMSQMVALVHKLAGAPPLVTHSEGCPADVEGTLADTAHAAATLGWRAKVQFEEGLAKTVEWYRARVQEGSPC